MEVDDASEIKIERCHRIGVKQPGQTRPRPIIVKFHWDADKRRVWQNRDKLKSQKGDAAMNTTSSLGAKIAISQDFPDEVRLQREILKSILNKAKLLKMNGYITVDKLVLEGTTYTVNDLMKLKTINPSLIGTKDVTTDLLAFYSIASPLSNFHPAEFMLDGKHFKNVEQYFHYCKAHFYENLTLAGKIIRAASPAQCLSLGKLVKSNDLQLNQRWERHSYKVMTDGCRAKFMQNRHLRDFLLDTQNMRLAEANPHDKYWSTGLALDDPNLASDTSWVGENKLGEILEPVRNDLQRLENY
jgi:ribA/ribD-fused uncharacterized protein